MGTYIHQYDARLGNEFSRALPSIRKRIASKSFGQHDSQFGVGGSTLRAFRNWPQSPGAVYREWARVYCDGLLPERIAVEMDTPAGFLQWHTGLADSLGHHWIRCQGMPLSFAHRHKLIDLFVKWLSEHDFRCPPLNDALINHANCALDSQTLDMLNKGLSMALPISKPSMGHVHCRATYLYCQSLIDDFARHFGGTRLLFDYFAWREGGSAS